MRDIKNFFREEDFYNKDGLAQFHETQVEKILHYATTACGIANALLREYVESCPRVYVAKYGEYLSYVRVQGGRHPEVNHTARLIAIEPIAGGEKE